MKSSKKQITTIAVSVGIVLLALVLTILRWCVAGFTLCSHPIFMFLLTVCAGFGIMYTVQGFLYKSPVWFMTAAILMLYTASYCLADFAHLPWWLILIADVALAAIYVGLSLMTAGNKTESIALNADPEYKDYKTRRAEKEAAEAEKPEEELPKIKSFKD